MKYAAAALSVLALATATAAAPAEIKARQECTQTCSASSGGQQFCCTGALTCLVQVIGSQCSNTAYCCSNYNAPPGGTLINVNVLNCVKIL